MRTNTLTQKYTYVVEQKMERNCQNVATSHLYLKFDWGKK